MKGKKLCGAVSVIILVIALCSQVMTVYADGYEKNADKAIVRVAFYQLDGFFEYDESGNEIGYGVDYLNELKNYANIEWEYVPVDSWESIGPMMKNGEVDIRLPVSTPSTPSEKYDYSVEPILMTFHSIMTLKSRADLFYHDYDTIAKLKIGIVDGQLSRTNVGSYLQTIDVMDNLIIYDDYNSCKSALEAGEIDALISNVMDQTDDLKILDKFSLVDNCITTLKGNPYYTIINNAMTELKLDNPSFQSELYEKYYPERANEPFTKEETEFISKTDQLTVAVYTDRKPVCYIDKDGEYQGIAIDMARLLSKKIGIKFSFIPVTTDTQLGMLDKADLVMPVPQNVDRMDCFVTTSCLDTEIVMVVRNGDTEPTDDDKVGVLSSTSGIYKTMSELNEFVIVPYESNREALNALQRGEIRAFANSSYVVNWMLENPRYENLASLHYKTYPLAYDICGRNENSILLSILNKGIRAISDDEKEALVQNGSKLSMDDLTLSDWLYIYRAQIVVVLASLAVLLAAALTYNHKRTLYINKITESGKKQEEANRAKSEFLARMSHDMRTPLNVIMGMSHIAGENDNPADTVDCLEKINISSEFLLGLINDVLDMEYIESGKMTLHPVPYSGKEFTQYITAVIKPLCVQKNIDFKYTFDGASDDFVVIQDKLRINQIYFNLLSNAVKFTPEGGKIKFHSHFTKTDHNTLVIDVTISDTGIGMKPEFMVHMFEPFTQEGQVIKPIGEGTGLGLSIVKRLCDLMKMTISVQSELGKGTVFTLRGEYELASEKAIESANARNLSVSADASVLKGRTLLVCEDHPLNQEIIKRLLEKKGAMVVVADDGRRGVGAFENSAPGFFDAILMDVRMPVMDGLEATRAIRSLNRTDAGTIPIIALTANAYDEDVQKCIAAGMNAHLTKPLNPQNLYNVFAELMK